MSSLHKRLVHRSTDGCCICRAKSSSSRFTASGKYEQFFTRCFQLGEARGGDICNACVLLVKRFKKLPLDTSQHWAHVVDARAGPGVKNFVRERRRESCRERGLASKRKSLFTKKIRQENLVGPKVSDFIDLRVWKQKKICCGTIFVNAAGEAILDPRFISKCPCHGQTQATPHKPQTEENFKASLMSLENIVTKELENVQSGQNEEHSQMGEGDNFKVPERKERKDSENSCDSKISNDQDEGFFDRSSSSPCFEESSSHQNGYLQIPIMSQKIRKLPKD